MKGESQLHPDAIKSATEDYHEMDVDDDVPQSSTITTKNNITFATSLWVQYVLLVKRMTLQAKRNKSVLYIQFFHHLLSGLLLGGIFFGIGNNASQTVAIFKYCVSVNVFFMFTHVMTPVLLCKYSRCPSKVRYKIRKGKPKVIVETILISSIISRFFKLRDKIAELPARPS